MNPPRLLVVDDDPLILKTLALVLRDNGWTEVALCGSAAEALAAVEAGPPPDVVITDVKMRGMDGLQLLDALKARDGDIAVIVVSGHGTIQTAVDAVRRGAYSFLEKPVDNDALVIHIRNALALRDTSRAVKSLTARVNVLADSVAGKWKILGKSPAAQALRTLIEKAARSDVRVLVTGEHGTGKELVARNIHLASRRASKPFVEVNCAAIADALTESELFGHEKGAFTGATGLHRGRFEQAHGGTLFLDEIGEMPLATQAKLLRVLEDGRITRVGGEKSVDLDVRIIAATNRDLRERVRAGTFRADLLSRLEAVTIHVPPLRERRDDVAEIFGAMFVRECSGAGRTDLRLDDSAFGPLIAAPWPGNVRELRNVAARIVGLADSGAVTADTVESFLTPAGAPAGDTLESLLDVTPLKKFEDTVLALYIRKHLRECHDNMSTTAERLDTARSNLYKLTERLKIPRSSHQE